jgi:hypothetical protein
MHKTAFDYHVCPTTDGYDHIRVHPKGATALGRLLCNGAHTPFTHPQMGTFASLEGYWQWIRTGGQYEIFRRLTGENAVGVGMRFNSVHRSDFHDRIIEGLVFKIEQNKRLTDLLTLSLSPFVRYNDDAYRGDHQVIHACSWFLDSLETYRAAKVLALERTVSYFPFTIDQLLAETTRDIRMTRSPIAVQTPE